jgi:hypothetical protein
MTDRTVIVCLVVDWRVSKRLKRLIGQLSIESRDHVLMTIVREFGSELKLWRWTSKHKSSFVTWRCLRVTNDTNYRTRTFEKL